MTPSFRRIVFAVLCLCACPLPGIAGEKDDLLLEKKKRILEKAEDLSHGAKTKQLYQDKMDALREVVEKLKPEERMPMFHLMMADPEIMKDDPSHRDRLELVLDAILVTTKGPDDVLVILAEHPYEEVGFGTMGEFLKSRNITPTQVAELRDAAKDEDKRALLDKILEQMKPGASDERRGC